VNTNKQSYGLGETVIVSGKVSNSDLTGYIALAVGNSKGPFKIDQLHPSSNGTYQYSFILSGSNAVPGQWSLSVGYGAATQHITFSVQDVNIALPVKILSTQVTDTSGHTMTSVRVDSQVLISVSITNIGSKVLPLYTIVQIERADGSTDSLSWQSTSLGSNAGSNSGFAWTPSLAGTYKVKVFVWQSTAAPIPLSDSYTFTVMVGP
jgi:3D (Asp-Asp-Asp) domain-containing protein